MLLLGGINVLRRRLHLAFPLIAAVTVGALGAPPDKPRTASDAQATAQEEADADTKADVLAENLLATAAGEIFQTRRTDHFVFCHDTAPEVLTPLVARLEGTVNAIFRFCDRVGIETQPFDPLGVLLFNRHEDFAAFARTAGLSGNTAAGFYDPRTNVSAFGNMRHSPTLEQLNEEIERGEEAVARARRRQGGGRAAREQREQLTRYVSRLRSQRDALVERFNRFVVQHEGAHQVFHNIGVHVRNGTNPAWLVEGLACQFEVPESRGMRGLGRVNHMRLADLRDALGVSLDAKRITEEQLAVALASGRFLPVERLVSESRLFLDGGDNLVHHYAQAWALVYYFARKDRAAFAAYVRDAASRPVGTIARRRDEIELIRTHFGPPDADFQKAWLKFMLKLPLDRREAGR